MMNKSQWPTLSVRLHESSQQPHVKAHQLANTRLQGERHPCFQTPFNACSAIFGRWDLLATYSIGVGK